MSTGERIERCRNCGEFIIYIDSEGAWMHLADSVEGPPPRACSIGQWPLTHVPTAMIFECQPGLTLVTVSCLTRTSVNRK